MKKQLQGTIVSNKMAKTAVVRVGQIRELSKYKKRQRVDRHYKAHLEQEGYEVGDKVIIEECRPISKEKKWKIIKKI